MPKPWYKQPIYEELFKNTTIPAGTNEAEFYQHIADLTRSYLHLDYGIGHNPKETQAIANQFKELAGVEMTLFLAVYLKDVSEERLLGKRERGLGHLTPLDLGLSREEEINLLASRLGIDKEGKE